MHVPKSSPCCCRGPRAPLRPAPLAADDAHAYAFDYSEALLRPVRTVTRTLPYRAQHLKTSKAMQDDPA
jgi:hypothetical protein